MYQAMRWLRVSQTGWQRVKRGEIDRKGGGCDL
jgi:hypothetical protein